MSNSYLLILLFVTIGFSQTTFTDEEILNLENEFIYLENMVDSLSYQDSLKALMIETLKLEVNLSNEEIKTFLIPYFRIKSVQGPVLPL